MNGRKQNSSAGKKVGAVGGGGSPLKGWSECKVEQVQSSQVDMLCRYSRHAKASF